MIDGRIVHLLKNMCWRIEHIGTRLCIPLWDEKCDAVLKPVCGVDVSKTAVSANVVLW